MSDGILAGPPGEGPPGTSAAQMYGMTITGAMVHAGGAADAIRWSTPDLPSTYRLVACRSALTEAFNFTTPAPASTITLEVRNDSGDVLYTIPIDVAHGTVINVDGTGAVPLVVGPYAGQAPGPLAWYIYVTTDAASLSLVSSSVGSVAVELAIVATTPVAISTTPIP